MLARSALLTLGLNLLELLETLPLPKAALLPVPACSPGLACFPCCG